MSIEDYYNECIQTAKNEILGKTKDYIVEVKTEELIEYYAASLALPPFVVDFDHGEYDPIVSSRMPDIPIDLRFPVKLEPRIEKVVTKESNPHVVDFRLGLDGDRLVVFARIPTDATKPNQAIETAIQLAKRQIGYKNQNVNAGNSRIRNELKEFIEKLKADYHKREAIIKSAIEKVPIKLEKRSRGAISVDFHAKKTIAPAMPKVKNREEELILAHDKVEAVVDLLGNGGRSFETTPKVYSQMEEEELRDILLGWLNAVFEGEATGETFSKMGKTDIHLKLAKGNILIVECKIWNGEKYLQEGIDQLFQYLTWRENFGILIMFCKTKSFTDIVEKAKTVVTNHATCINGSLKMNNAADFSASHTFPGDARKTVIVRYLLFNLYYGS